MTGQLTFAFIAGTVASANPCGFALLPAYVARQLTPAAASSSRADALARALAIGALTTVGFLVVFGSLGTAITLGLHWLTQVVPWLALAIGVLLVIAGIAVLSGRRIGLSSLSRVRPAAGTGYRSVVLFGLGYGVASLSCTLPIFLVVAGTALTGSAPAAPLTFAAYALGMGTILTALAVAVALSRDGVAKGVRRLRPHASRLSGALLIAAGAYVVYYWAFELASPTGSGSGSKPIRIATQISTSVQAWLSGHTGKTVSAILAGLLAALAVAILARAARRRALRRTSSDHADLVRPTPPSLGAAMLREPSRAMMEADRAPLEIRD